MTLALIYIVYLAIKEIVFSFSHQDWIVLCLTRFDRSSAVFFLPLFRQSGKPKPHTHKVNLPCSASRLITRDDTSSKNIYEQPRTKPTVIPHAYQR